MQSNDAKPADLAAAIDHLAASIDHFNANFERLLDALSTEADEPEELGEVILVPELGPLSPESAEALKQQREGQSGGKASASGSGSSTGREPDRIADALPDFLKQRLQQLYSVDASSATNAAAQPTAAEVSCHPDGMLYLDPDDASAPPQCGMPSEDTPSGEPSWEEESQWALPYAPELPAPIRQLPDHALEDHLPAFDYEEREDFDSPQDIWGTMSDLNPTPPMQLASRPLALHRTIPDLAPEHAEHPAQLRPVSWHAPAQARPVHGLAYAAQPDAQASARSAEVLQGSSVPVAASPLPPDFQFPELGKVEPVSAAESRLSNGLRTFFVEDLEAPVVSGALIFPGGAASSPTGKVGLATIASSLQASGGTETVSYDELIERLENIAAGIESGTTPQATALTFECLPNDLPTVLELMSDVLQKPAMPESKLKLLSAQIEDAIEHRNDSKTAVALRKVKQLLYGKGSLYSREPGWSDVRAMTQEAARDWLAQRQRPDTARLALIGAVKQDAALQQIKAHLGDWQTAPGQPATPPGMPVDKAPSAEAGHKVYLIDQPGLQQAVVALAEPGVAQADPDVHALDVLGGLLNGLGGLLFNSVRSEAGLAYSVSANWDAPISHPGLFLAVAETAQPGDAIAAMQRVFARVLSEELPADLIANTKEERTNAYVFQYASKAGQLQREVTFDLVGLPKDYTQKYQEALQRVTPAGVLQAARRHLHPDAQTIVVVGDAKRVRGGLEQLGLPIVMTSME